MRKEIIVYIAGCLNSLFHQGIIDADTRNYLAILARKNEWTEFKKIIRSFQITGNKEINNFMEVLSNVE